MTTASGSGSSEGIHVASIAHDGRLWTAYLDFKDDPHRPESYRACLRFDPVDASDGRQSRSTAVIIIEDSYDRAIAKVREMDERQLSNLLRSVLPDDGEDA